MEWIKVEDRLPETGVTSVFGSDWVLGVTVTKGGFREVNIVRYVSTKKPYWKLIGDDVVAVSHWMPLPTPPDKE